MNRRRILTWLIAAIALIAVAALAVLIWYTQFRSVEEELDTADRDAALVTVAPAEGDGSAADASPEPVDLASVTDWVIAADADNQVGYRIQEVIAGVDTEGVGRTDQVTGSLTVDGTTLTEASFEVDVASIQSDSGSRDGQFRGRIMSTDEFPTATFVLTEPLELGTETVEGAAVIVDATGDLTLRGATNSVTFSIDATLANGRIGVLGSIPVVFADYGIDNPSFGSVTTEDDGLLEFVLVFEPAS